jgi:hypothetical protein
MTDPRAETLAAGVVARTVTCPVPPEARPRLRGARPGTAQPPRLPEPIVVTRRSEPQVRLVSWSVMRRTRRTRGVLSLPQTRGAGNPGSGRVASDLAVTMLTG